MKVVAFNGSPRKDGNTSLLIHHVFDALNSHGIDTELIQVGGTLLRGCTACYQCFANKNGQCIQKNDILNECVEKMQHADGIILGSPTYFADITSETKALIDRAGFVSRANGNLLKRKVGASVIAVRRAGAIHAFDSINHFFLISEMIVCGSNYWNIGMGREKGEVEKDEEGVGTMKVLGENMAWLMKKLAIETGDPK
ncbi:MAG: flavodoxin family protein [Verrucomicrobia bacterium]|nr:flavodoxin family protein [Verrucomicrobiota bacterium]